MGTFLRVRFGAFVWMVSKGSRHLTNCKGDPSQTVFKPGHQKGSHPFYAVSRPILGRVQCFRLLASLSTRNRGLGGGLTYPRACPHSDTIPSTDQST